MAIYPPGQPRGRHRQSGGRSVVASLSLTAMVDMFTVLVVFLLMNYKSTDTILYLPKEVELPEAMETKELKPSHVVTISEREILVEKEIVVSTYEVKEQKKWDIPKLRAKVLSEFKKAEEEFQKKMSTRVQNVLRAEKEEKNREKQREKVTIQADQDIDFLTIKKVMFTLTTAGAREINFAVLTKKKKKMAHWLKPAYNMNYLN